MPILSSLGALTYTKVFLGEQWYWYIETTPGNQNQINNFDFNGENLYLAGNVAYSANANSYNPQVTFVNNGNLVLPTDNYHAFYESGSNREGLHIDVSFDSTSNLIYFTGFQDIVNNGFTQTSGVTRSLNTSGTLQNTYVDLPTATNRNRIPRAIETHANGSYTVAGENQEANTTSIAYITNFTGNTKNWAKILPNLSSILNLEVTSNSFILGSYTISGNLAIVELAGNGNSILNQYELNRDPGYITIDSGSNIYFTTGNATITSLGKIDTTGNIVWQKQMSANVQTTSAMQITSVDYAEGNVYISGQANAPGGNLSNGLPLAIMSFNSNTGNINWQRRFYETGINFLTGETAVKYNDGNLYISSTQITGNNYGYMIKVPANGSIPGNGSYAGNLVYDTSNVTISNANVIISTANLTLSNASNTAIVTSNITANTANVWTFNSTRLV